MRRKTAVFVLGTLEYAGVKRGDALSKASLSLLDRISEHADLDVDLVFVSQDPFDAGKSKSKLGMKRIRQERPRVLQEIGEAKPDLVICFGPVATACVWGKGNLVESNLLRQDHRPLLEDLPVFVTFSLDAVAWKAGLARWLELDVMSAAHGNSTTEWGEYTVLQPGTPEWDEMPEEIWNTIHGVARAWDEVPLGFDLETFPGLDPWAENARIRMAVLSDQVGRAWIVQCGPNSQVPLWLREILANPRIAKVGSNPKFDYVWCRRFGIKVLNVQDTSTREHIIDESNPKKDLKSLTFKYVPKLGDYSKQHRDLVRERGDWALVNDEEQYQYCGGDGEASIGTYLGQEAALRDKDLQRGWSLFRDLYGVLADIECRGMLVDLNTNRALDELYTAKLHDLRSQITRVLGPVNLNSPTQLAKALKATVPDIRLTKRDWVAAVGDDEGEEAVTNRAVLEREAHRHPVIPLVLEFRKYRTRHSTFIEGVRERHLVTRRRRVRGQSVLQHFIHPRYRTDVVETYRLSSQAPNGQNIPRKDNDDAHLTVKQQFRSRFPGGLILEADQSQVEIRVAAWLSGDEKMLQAIRSGEDIHTAMASIMLGKPVASITEEERQSCKARTFLILYGGGAKKLARDLKISKRAAQRLIDDYFATFTGLHDYIKSCKSRVKVDLKVVTPFGFTRSFVEPEQWDSSEGFRIERQAFNTIVQSTAACITYVAMIELEERMREEGLVSIMIGQVHDSVLIDVAAGEGQIVGQMAKQIFESAGVLSQTYGVSFDVPLHCDVEIGEHWGAVKKMALHDGGDA